MQRFQIPTTLRTMGQNDAWLDPRGAPGRDRPKGEELVVRTCHSIPHKPGRPARGRTSRWTDLAPAQPLLLTCCAAAVRPTPSEPVSLPSPLKPPACQLAPPLPPTYLGCQRAPPALWPCPSPAQKHPEAAHLPPSEQDMRSSMSGPVHGASLPSPLLQPTFHCPPLNLHITAPVSPPPGSPPSPCLGSQSLCALLQDSRD